MSECIITMSYCAEPNGNPHIFTIWHMLRASCAGIVSCKLILGPDSALDPNRTNVFHCLRRASPKANVEVSFVLLFVCSKARNFHRQDRTDLHQRGAGEWMNGAECVWCSSASPQSYNLPSGMCKSRLCICSTLQLWQIYTARACVSRAPEAKKM